MQPRHDATLRAILNQSSTRPGALMQLSAEASARIRNANEGNELAEPAAQALELRDAMPYVMKFKAHEWCTK
jgi:arginine/lysine/ornithine decarboxylase